MTHEKVLQEMVVEKYLLGELRGSARDGFEDHLFECEECAADVKAGVVFLRGARQELRAPKRAKALVKEVGGWTSWFTNPWVLGPALAASLAVVAVQTLVVLPRLNHEVAAAETPEILNSLVLANAGARGEGTLPAVTAESGGSFLLSVDIPAREGLASYRCTLVSPKGSEVWHAEVSPKQANDALLIRLPVGLTAAGVNSLLIQGLPAGESAGGRLVDLAQYKFNLNVSR
jgi:hypothetical protein